MRKIKRERYIPIGVYSCATLRKEDLIPKLVGILDELRLNKTDRKELNKIKKDMKCADYYDSENVSFDLNDCLFDMLNNYCLPYTYFSSSEGDGACFGVWVSDESIHDAIISDELYERKKAPIGYREYVIDINDHGNMTLYNRKAFGHGYKDIEVWSIV